MIGLIEYVPIFSVGLFIIWIAAEFRGGRWLRILLGSTIILAVFVWALFSTVMARHDADIRYGEVMGDLVAHTVNALESGQTQQVIGEIKKLNESYENFDTANHLIILKETAERLGKIGLQKN